MTNDDEPQTIGAAIPEALKRRLEAMGVTPASALPPPTPQAETEDEARERLEARLGVFRARWASQVPPMYAEASWANLDDAQRFTWPDDSLNLVLAGSVGTGKTYAAYALGNAACAKGLWVQAVTVVDLLAALRPDGNLGLAKAARTCHLLILDDLAASKVSDWAQEQLTDLLDQRIREDRRTVVTTNATEQQLEAAWGGRFLDRLRYRRTVHVLTGASRRVGAW